MTDITGDQRITIKHFSETFGIIKVHNLTKMMKQFFNQISFYLYFPINSQNRFVSQRLYRSTNMNKDNQTDKMVV